MLVVREILEEKPANSALNGNGIEISSRLLKKKESMNKYSAMFNVWREWAEVVSTGELVFKLSKSIWDVKRKGSRSDLLAEIWMADRRLRD